MKEAQTLQEALNEALNDLQAWKSAALAAQSELEKQKLLVSELLSLDDFSSSYTLKTERDQYKIAYEDLMSGDKLIICKSALAEIRADAVQCAVNSIVSIDMSDLSRDFTDGYEYCRALIIQYAEQIRQGGAK